MPPNNWQANFLNKALSKLKKFKTGELLLEGDFNWNLEGVDMKLLICPTKKSENIRVNKFLKEKAQFYA